jgi:hypothetical protein
MLKSLAGAMALVAVFASTIGVEQHVPTADYLTNSIEFTNPACKTPPPTPPAATCPYVPYLTYAYTQSDHYDSMRENGLTMVYYTDPFNPNPTDTECYPQSKCPFFVIAPGGKFADVEAYGGPNCTSSSPGPGNTPSTYVYPTSPAATDYMANMYLLPAPTAFNTPTPTPTATPAHTNRAVLYIQAALDSYAANLASANPSPAPRVTVPTDYYYLDNVGTDQNYTPAPCGFNTPPGRPVWDQDTANVLNNTWEMDNGLNRLIPYFVNALGYYGSTAIIDDQLQATNTDLVKGAQYEHCYGGDQTIATTPTPTPSTGRFPNDWYVAEYAEINTIANGKIFWCWNQYIPRGSLATPDPNFNPRRIYAYASFLLSYETDMAIYQTTFPQPTPTASFIPSTFDVYPETGLVPTNADITSSTVDGYYRSDLGAYYRSWASCTYQGTPLTQGCAVEINPFQSGAVSSLPQEWCPPINGHQGFLQNEWVNKMSLAGTRGVLDGGTAGFNATPPPSIGLGSAVILANRASCP